MNVDQIVEWIAAGDIDSVEGAWLEAVEQNVPVDQMTAVLEALVSAGKTAEAETMASMLLSERLEAAEPVAALELARALLLAVPDSTELRKQTVALYQRAHGSQDHFRALLAASGLEAGQSPRRATRTLDVCLSLQAGDYLVNRFDHRAARVERFDDALGEFVLATAGGATQLDPKKLADEFEPADPADFRVLCQLRGGELGRLIQDDPAGVLIGICQSRGGQVDADALKALLVGNYMESGKWSSWWSRARTAAKRCPQLSVDGRSPVVVSYHPQGRTLEEELAGAAAEARTPQTQLAVIQQYLRECAQRKQAANEAFLAPLVAALAKEITDYRTRRPADALLAALALDAALSAGAPAPQAVCPTAAELLAESRDPAAAIAHLHDASLWPAALAALSARPDAADAFQKLLGIAPASQLDAICAQLRAAGRGEAIDSAVADALANPIENIALCVWLWKGPAETVAACPPKLELLSRLLGALQTAEHDWNVRAADRKGVYQEVRSALSANNYAAYRQAVGEMTEAVAATIKRRVERSDGLAETVREQMLQVLKENFYSLFLKARVEPWLDENVLWTTEKSLHAREAELKNLMEVKMLENSRAIGIAASHGDLSENSEWQYAIEEQRRLKAQAAQMQDELAKARILHAQDVPDESVGIGSRVTLKRLPDGPENVLTFLGPWDSDPSRGVLSYQSALALALMGKQTGESAVLRIGEEEGEYRIERIESALD